MSVAAGVSFDLECKDNKFLSLLGMNPMDLRRGISAAVSKVVEVLKSRAQMISTTEEIAQVNSMDRMSHLLSDFVS